ncbi:MAG: hypothetical protein M1837_000858 [Sclerophora amabilis]|nr:MAG: hypothetical protein M1837_000858 [Sclerophora amabilis]
MSSRALRKAQRLREEQLANAKLEHEADEAENEEDDVIEEKAAPQRSLFAMLNEDNEDDEEPERQQDLESHAGNPQEEDQTLKASAKRKKKKKTKDKAKIKPDGKPPAPDQKNKASSSFKQEQLDDIDIALQSLASATISAPNEKSDTVEVDPALQELCSLLSVDSQHLIASNEMRRLFGRAALDSNGSDGDGAAAGRRRGGRGAQQGGLAAAVNAPNGPGGRGLAGLGLRRNIFIQGKEEWPRGTSGGLGMEVAAKGENEVVEFRFVHNRAYQDVQQQFESCRESMDPERMVQLLHFNPYHISTLLQVSEIAKHEGDHSVSGGLLERCLFSFGRAVHSSFAGALSKGKARLSFRRPENREFFLAGWRYIRNLGMRGTWRTAYEWAKLLLSLDPISDPYSILLLIDQLALRARQPSFLLSVNRNTLLSTSSLLNMQLSLALAHHQLDEHDLSRRVLFSALHSFPYVFTSLFQALDIERLPPSIWGLSAPSTHLQILSELYCTSAKDLWSTPEATSLLMEIANIPTSPLPVPSTQDNSPSTIPLSLARHVLLTESQPLIALLPRSLTSRSTSSTDPVPPDDDLPSYNAAPAQSSVTSTSGNTAALSSAERQEVLDLQAFFQTLREHARVDEEGRANVEPPEGMNPMEVMTRMGRMQELLRRMGEDQPFRLEEVVREVSGEDGRLEEEEEDDLDGDGDEEGGGG